MSEKMINIDNDDIKFDKESITSNYRLRSEMSQEVLSRQPGFVENWSLPIFFIILLVILGSTWFVHYPDVINTRVILTAENAPKEVIVRQEGRLIKLFVKNDQMVKSNEVIGWMESTARHEEVLELSKLLDSALTLLKGYNSEQTIKVLAKDFYHLGELQPEYQKFDTDKETYNDYSVRKFHLKKMDMILSDIQSLKNLNKSLKRQQELIEKDVGLAKATLDMYEILNEKKVISREEYRVESSKYMTREKAVPILESSLYSNEIQLRAKIQESEQLGHDIANEKALFEQQLQSFKSKVDEWIFMHLLRAPINGRVSFTTSLQENKFLSDGLIIAYINPIESKFFAEAILSQNNLGKLDTGMMVQLRFDAYPYEEWGYVSSKIAYISNIPSDSGFLATMQLTDGLKTSDRKMLSYKNGLKGQAIIITKDMRLLERFYYNMIKSISVQ